MTKDEAYDIVELYDELEDKSCTCFQNAPCSKCVNQPSEEMYEEAQEVLYKECL